MEICRKRLKSRGEVRHGWADCTEETGKWTEFNLLSNVLSESLIYRAAVAACGDEARLAAWAERAAHAQINRSANLDYHP